MVRVAGFRDVVRGVLGDVRQGRSREAPPRKAVAWNQLDLGPVLLGERPT